MKGIKSSYILIMIIQRVSLHVVVVILVNEMVREVSSSTTAGSSDHNDHDIDLLEETYRTSEIADTGPCSRSPCGHAAECRVIDGRSICVCKHRSFTASTSCSAVCQADSECPSNKQCKNRECVDPCPTDCGTDIPCEVINHVAWCTCPPETSGDCLQECKEPLQQHPLVDTSKGYFNKTNKLLFIGIDGLVVEQFQKLCYPLDNISLFIAEVGGVLNAPSTMEAVVSGPGWATIFTGTWANKHGVDHKVYYPSKEATIFTYLSDLQYKVAITYKWIPLIRILNREEQYSIDALQRSQSENLNVEFAKEQLQAGMDATFIVFDDVDEIGHGFGWSKEYDRQSRWTIGKVREMLEIVEYREKRYKENWLVVLASDHGREAFFGNDHKRQTKAERSAFIGIRTTSNVVLNEASTSEQLYLTSVVPSILTHIGAEVNLEYLESTSLIKRKQLDGTFQDSPYIYDLRIENGLIIWNYGGVVSEHSQEVRLFINNTLNVSTDVTEKKQGARFPLGAFQITARTPGYYPLSVSFDNTITAAVRLHPNTTLFFTSSGNVLEFSLSTKQLIHEFHNISSYFPGMLNYSMSIRAALRPSDSYMIFFLTENRVLVYDTLSRRIRQGFPKPTDNFIRNYHFFGNIVAGFDYGNESHIIMDTETYLVLSEVSERGCTIKEQYTYFENGWYSTMDTNPLIAILSLSLQRLMFLYGIGDSCIIYDIENKQDTYRGPTSEYLNVTSLMA